MTVESATDRIEAVSPGCTFVARVGATVDRHSLAAAAVAAGAESILCERPLADLDIPQCVVPSAAEAFALVCDALHGFPGRRVPLIGVTGTDGKTTTTWLLRSILSQPAGARLGSAVALCGTIDIDDGLLPQPAELTTPGPMALAEWLGRSCSNGVSAAIAELSSHALDQDRAAALRLDAAIVTGVTRDHLDYHGTKAEYIAAKAKILNLVKPGGRIVLGASAAEAMISNHDLNGKQVVIYGDHLNATASAVVTRESVDGLEVTLHAGVETIEVVSPLVGRHNAENILAAALAASHLGATPGAIRDGVRSLESVPGRFERIPGDVGFHVFVDYAHTPDAIRSAIAVARRLARRRVHVVAGAGGGRDSGKRPLMGAALQDAESIVLTSDNPRSESAGQICREIASGISRDASCQTVLCRSDAIATAIGAARDGDIVLVLGKGHETTQTIGGECQPFDDRSVCAERIAELVSRVAL